MIAWFVCPYKRMLGRALPMRYCAMNDFTPQIKADGGKWSETEILGDRAIVKVDASSALLTTIAGTAGFRRLPLGGLDDPLSSINAGQRNAIRNEITDAGYTLAELNAEIPDLSTVTLRQVLTFMAKRRRKPRYDSASDQIVCDGPIQSCRPVSSVENT